MNDAPSAVVAPGSAQSIDPARQLLLVHRAKDDSVPQNKVLFDTIRVYRDHLAAGHAPWSVSARQVTAYQSIGNGYYRPDSGNVPVPNLPPVGTTQVGVMAYQPSTDPIANLAAVDSLWKGAKTPVEVLVLPSFGIGTGLIDPATNWAQRAPWPALQAFVERNGIQLLVTAAYAKAYGPNRETAVIVQPGMPMRLAPSTQGWPPSHGSGLPPTTIDLAHARVGIVVDRDALLPEMSLNLAKSGVDIILSPFDYGTAAYAADVGRGVPWAYDVWLTRSNEGVHVVAANDFGYGIIVSNGGGYIDTLVTARFDQNSAFRTLTLNSAGVRTKYLNAYTSFDLAALLGGGSGYSRRPSMKAPRSEVLPHRAAVTMERSAALIEMRATAATAEPHSEAEAHRRSMPPGLRPPEH
jgi:hypothetical protein